MFLKIFEIDDAYNGLEDNIIPKVRWTLMKELVLLSLKIKVSFKSNIFIGVYHD